MNWEQVVVTLLPYAATAAISVYAIRNSRQLKELDIKDNERGRIFELQKVVTVKAIEALVQASFRLGQQEIRFVEFLQQKETECDPKLYEQMKSDLDFIEINKPLFPVAVREKIHAASDHFTRMLQSNDGVDFSFRLQVLKDAAPVVQEAKQRIEQFLDQYNLFNAKSK